MILTWFRKGDYFRRATIEIVRFRFRGPRADWTRADILHDSAVAAAAVLLISCLLGPVQRLHDDLTGYGRRDGGLLFEAEFGQDLSLDSLEADLVAVALLRPLALLVQLNAVWAI